ncbi:MAG: hypothetical protein H7A41_07310 [Chlamydiales bacterium]|nr:hypothetical protein [Chlamydiales bacterium]
MAELVSKHQFQQALQNAIKAGERPEDRAVNGGVVEKYVGQLEAQALETATQIEQLRAQVLDLQKAAEGTVPREDLERVTGELERVRKQAEETGHRQHEELVALKAELEEARKEDPRIAGLARQVQDLTEERDGAVRLAEELRAKQALGETVPKAELEDAQRTIAQLEERIEPLTDRLRVAESEENPRVLELKEQIAEFERAREETTVKHQAAIRDLEADVERLTLAAKDQERQIKEITRARDEQAETIRILQLEMRGYQEAATEVARTPHDQAEAQSTEARRQHGEIVEEDSPEAQVNKAVLAYKIGLLEAKQAEHLAIQERLLQAHQAGAEEALRSPDVAVVGEIIKALTELHRTTEEAFVAAREEHRVLDQVAEPEFRNEPGIELALNKVRSLESQVASLTTSIETYQKSGANQILPDVRLLQELISLVPGPSKGEARAYVMNAVKAIKAMQETLSPRYDAGRVAHTGIEKLLKDVYRWRGEYMQLIRGVIDSTGAYVGVDFHEAKVKLAGFMKQLVRKHAEMDRLLNLPQDQVQAELAQARLDHQQAVGIHGPLDAVVDGGRDEDAIAVALNDVQFHALRVHVLETIQTQHHQPLELKMGVLGTMQRLIVGFFSMLFSIPGVLIGGLQTMGHPIVGKPNP